MAAPLARSELTGLREGVTFVITFEWAGRTWYFADHPSRVPADLPGPAYTIAPVELEDDAELLSEAPQVRQIGVDLTFPQFFDVQDQIFSRRRDPHGLRAEVRIYVPGRVWADCPVVLVGRLDSPRVTRFNGLVTTIAEEAYEDRGAFPPATAVVSRDTWVDGNGDPVYDKAVRGRMYPFVFGDPGVYTNGYGEEDYCTGSPGLLVDVSNRTLLICGAPVEAASVKVLKTSGTGSPDGKSFTVSHTTDGLGRRVAVVTLDATDVGADISAEEGATYWVRWSAGGGIQSDKGRAMRGIGEICIYLLRYSTLRVDRGAWQSARDVLDQYRVAGYIDSTVVPQDFIQSELLPLAPVTMRSSTQGARPIPIPHHWTYSDARVALTEGPELGLVSDPSYERAEPVSEIRLDYAFDPASGGFLRQKAAVGDSPFENGAKDVVRSADLARSYNVHRASTGDVFKSMARQSKWVARTSTADLYLIWASWWYGSSKIHIEWLADPRYGFLSFGDVVTITSTTFPGISGRLAVITGASWFGPRYRIRTTIVQDASTTVDTG